MTRLALALALCAAPAAAEPLIGTLTATERTWPGTVSSAGRPSFVRIGPPTDPAAVATVTFENRPVHNMDEEFPLTYLGIEVHIIFDWQADGTESERITVLVPPGYAAVPTETTVPEDEVGVVQILRWEGM